MSRRAFWTYRTYYAALQEDASVGATVADILPQIESAADPVPDLVRDGSPYARLAAAAALARAAPRHEAVEPVLGQLLKRYPHFFAYAADTLAALGPAAAPLGHALLPLLRHPPLVQQLAVDAHGALALPEADGVGHAGRGREAQAPVEVVGHGTPLPPLDAPLPAQVPQEGTDLPPPPSVEDFAARQGDEHDVGLAVPPHRGQALPFVQGLLRSAPGPSGRRAYAQWQPKNTPDRSKLFGSHGQRPWV